VKLRPLVSRIQAFLLALLEASFEFIAAIFFALAGWLSFQGSDVGVGECSQFSRKFVKHQAKEVGCSLLQLFTKLWAMARAGVARKSFIKVL
tara:strand:- start:17966 stop:18241 length:276 start_codon:yes stop_codon:yes gene_type:complete